MAITDLSAADVATFLSSNPEFIKQHPDVFLNLELPSSAKGKTIFLAQRQVVEMRSELQKLESNLKELSFYAIENQEINHNVMQWCVNMLAEKDAKRMPETIQYNLERIFTDLKVAIKLWGVTIDSAYISDNTETQQAVAVMDSIYCGSQYPEYLLNWFNEKPASVAILPLANQEKVFGVLVFASDDAEHFQDDVGQGFLKMISAMASAAVSRLYD